MILNNLMETSKILSFAKKSFTKGGFRHVTRYISGLISLIRKTVRSISRSCSDEKQDSALHRILSDAKFEKELLEERYLQKIRYLFKDFEVILIIDDTLVQHDGPNIEETQKHFDHTTNSYVNGHQFLTSILYTPFLQLPLFPELYSKSSDSKIEMANKLISKLHSWSIKVNTVLFDSWFSCKETIEACLKSSMNVICAIKSNRNVKLYKKRKWQALSGLIKRVRYSKLEEKIIGENTYCVWTEKVKLTKLPFMRLVISHEKKENKLQENPISLISTDKKKTPEEILTTYKKRWKIETFHRDIKQNLGFAKAFFRKKEGIVRHAILVIMAYVILALFRFQRKLDLTIGECCEYLSRLINKGGVEEIVQIENTEERIKMFEKVFIS